MPFLPGDRLRNFDMLKREFMNMFPDLLSEFNLYSLRIDVYETETHVVASCEIPGIANKEDIDIQIDDNALTISGTVNKGHEVQEEQLYRRERFSGRFDRTVMLPASVIAEESKASYKNGILEIRMPKANSSRKKKVNIDFL
ncbi:MULTISPECIES: Hsp20/alpha crystallin family protein [Aneurinibacillus]|uniref:Heat shock protein Hsp20 n=1 Tax=Aneurinibacillus thermoaerophilus TaxID=143495 RepID=A0A1G8E152_ANETH|nr:MULTISPECIES: Hsp20/alpha crystallin family protein [Aneurinibacillus]AMA74142.1 heat-shock protein Hsp20 [Aneurinibacillus sp. XH2]MED0677278.1 Hsp20/alpha crystallin family protein [Aneurinibacillus thermoaerophilus]MED0677899.1 Hsp20/alpha crystallin family protein [Aneurinibacillus thermoaerophilus]MED0738545.1 Hsp20/alpha crystallin family protein [Aneurinibacillus thermoaerophilus]MED0758408.1 Hsp20/alpha crystallin family protein [Aneurinibacillus thermoaerophilus]